MRTVNNLLQSALKIDIAYQVQLSLQASSQEYVQLQREQLYSGVKKDNTEILPFYTPLTVQIKKSKGQITDHVTLRDTGDFYKGIFIKVDNPSDFTVDSSDSKSVKLQEKYSSAIFGLNDDSRTEFKPVAQAALIAGIEKELNRQ